MLEVRRLTQEAATRSFVHLIVELSVPTFNLKVMQCLETLELTLFR